jgi:Skp family chaperone for outer membrane proteins
LQEKLDAARKDTAQVETLNMTRNTEISKLESEVLEKQNQYKQAQQKKKDELNPKIDDTIKQIGLI